jgi:hypothetical protein
MQCNTAGGQAVVYGANRYSPIGEFFYIFTAAFNNNTWYF